MWSDFATWLALVSVVINILQWMRHSNLRKNYRAHSQAGFNDFTRVDAWCTAISKLEDAQEDTYPYKLRHAIRCAHSARGISEAARGRIVAFSREHLKMIPVVEPVGQPSLEPLPRPGKKQG